MYTAFSLLFAFCLPFRLIGGDLSADRRSPVGSLSVIVNLLSVACQLDRVSGNRYFWLFCLKHSKWMEPYQSYRGKRVVKLTYRQTQVTDGLSCWDSSANNYCLRSFQWASELKLKVLHIYWKFSYWWVWLLPIRCCCHCSLSWISLRKEVDKLLKLLN